MTPGTPPKIVLFDGVCALCNGSVRVLLRVDRARQLHYAPLEGDTAAVLARHGVPIPTDASTVVYVQDGIAFVRSRALFAIASQLGYPWRALSWLRLLPAWLTDLPYRLVARTRYRVFGKYDTCPMAPLEHRTRFLP